MPDVPPLHEQEAQGQFLEAVEKLVDGVVEDVRGGHLTRANVQSHAIEAIRLAQYRNDATLAPDVLKYGIDEIPDKDAATIFRISMQTLAGNVFEFLVLSTLDRRPEVRKLFEKPKRSTNMAKAKTPKKTTAKKFPLKPSGNVKPLGKPMRPAKKSAALPAATKIVPKALPAGHVMTAKKLKTITDKKGFSTFLLKYPLSWLLTDGTEPKKEIEAEIMRKVALDGHYADETTYEIQSSKKQEITLLVKTKIKPHQDPPPPIPSPTEPPFTPGDIVVSPKDLLNSATPPKVDPSPVPENPADEPVKASAKLGDETVNFDCTPWLMAATDQDLVTLADDEWAHSSMANVVATFCAAHDAKLQELIAGRSEKYLDTTMSVEVDAEQATDWINKFRPDVFPFVVEKNEANNEYLHDKAGLVPAGK